MPCGLTRPFLGRGDSIVTRVQDLVKPQDRVPEDGRARVPVALEHGQEPVADQFLDPRGVGPVVQEESPEGVPEVVEPDLADEVNENPPDGRQGALGSAK